MILLRTVSRLVGYLSAGQPGRVSKLHHPVYTCAVKHRAFGSVDLEYQRFDARRYLEERCPGNEFEVNDKKIHTQWTMSTIHNFYKEFHREWDNSNAKLLEFASGPYIHTLISAAPYVGQIYHSDYLEQCRGEALMWRDKNPNAYNWFPYFKYAVNTLEGEEGSEVVKKRGELLRSKLKDSLFVDMNSENMLPGYSGKFDIIYSGYCIETISPSSQGYKKIMQGVYDILNPKGFLLMLASIGCSWYIVDGVKYANYPLRIEEAITTLREVGFTLWYTESVKRKYEDGVTYINDKEGYSCFIAQKL